MTNPRSILTILSLLLTLAAPAWADLSVRLKAQAAVGDADVTLRDVAEVSGTQAAEVAARKVTGLNQPGATATVTLADVERVLAQAGVNRALVSLGGATACRVERQRPVESPENTAETPRKPTLKQDIAAPVAQANPQDVVEAGNAGDVPAVEAGASGTVRELVVRKIEELAGTPRAQLRLNFTGNDVRALDEAVGSDQIEIQPQATGALGRVPMVVRRYHGGIPAQPLRFAVDVAQQVRAVVVARPISRGQTILPQDVELKDVLLTHAGTPVTKLEDAVGQTARSLLRPGTTILADALQAPVLVKRGELVTLRCVSGTLVVTTVVRASEDGAMGETVRTTNEKTRVVHLMRITGSREGVLVDASDNRVAQGGER